MYLSIYLSMLLSDNPHQVPPFPMKFIHFIPKLIQIPPTAKN